MQYTVRCDMCSLLKGGQININFYCMEKVCERFIPVQQVCCTVKWAEMLL